jgi:hypothetical protein
MLVSNKNQSNRKMSARRDRNNRGVKGRQWGGKPSILDNQNVSRRNKKSSWGAKSLSNNQAGGRIDPGWGGDPHGGEWRTRFLEGSFVIAAGISNVVKNGVDQLTDWVKGGRQAVENVSIPPLKFAQPDQNDSLSPDRVEPEMEPGYDGGGVEVWQQDPGEDQIDENLMLPEDFQPLSDQKPVTASDLLRDNFEWSKMDSQDQEELGLDEEELVDQAGALRSMFSNRNSDT